QPSAPRMSSAPRDARCLIANTMGWRRAWETEARPQPQLEPGSWLQPRSRMPGSELRRDPMHGGALVSAMNGLHRFLDRRPQRGDLVRRLRLAVILGGALAFRQRQRKRIALSDLAGPDRDVQTAQDRTRLAHERRLGVVAPRRHAVDHDRVRLLQLA